MDPLKGSGLIFLPIGGCGEFGMNLSLYLLDDQYFIVDCGLAFPDPNKLGVDALLPNLEWVVQRFGAPAAYVITHGHEDHLGALPYALARWPAPVFAPRWAAELLRIKCERERQGLDEDALTVTDHGDVSRPLPGVTVEWWRVNHSLPDSFALIIEHGETAVLHTGDFKIDPTGTFEPPMDLEGMQERLPSGVTALVCDSTNAYKDGLTPGEGSTRQPLAELLRTAPGMCLVTTFSSNLWRLQTIIEIAAELGRKVVALGHGIELTLRMASDLGLYQPPPGVLVPADEFGRHEREQLIVIASGCQGERHSTFRRIVFGDHKKLQLMSGDRIIHSARIIPGNDRTLGMVFDECLRRGAELITARTHPDIHVSGHAYAGDIQKLITMLKPQFFIPVHGTYSHQQANQAAARACSPEPPVVLAQNLAPIDLATGRSGPVPAQYPSRIVLDGGSRQPMAMETLRERLRIGENSAAFVSVRLGTYEDVPPDVRLQLFGCPLTERDDWGRIQAGLIERCRLAGAGEATLDDREEAIRRLVRRELTRHLGGKKPTVVVHLHV